jgi:hypothetical protein
MLTPPAAACDVAGAELLVVVVLLLELELEPQPATIGAAHAVSINASHRPRCTANGVLTASPFC